ncbi:thrombospondin-1 like protein golden goal isoform X1 [Osmia lignaria lignaria]|uniref:thrombospondin-1 like protein golden goal isoform X1 n=1 Tax=Osmia lignaria lignaria TaxID=1437193 RepID=UPI00402B3B09
MNLKSKWLSLGILVIILLEFDIARSIMEETEELTSLKIHSPSSHVALSGDLVISVINSNETLDETKYKYEFKKENNQDIKQLDDNVSNELSLLRILYLFDDISELIGEIQLEKLPSENETVSIIIPCGYFTRGGIYVLQIEYKYKNSAVSIVSNYQTSKILDVKWPMPVIYLESQQITTYPNKPVKTVIKYDGVNCSPSDNVPVTVYILQLIYCGSTVTACYLQNYTYIQVLYHEEIREFLSSKTIFFQCEYFGLPGNYAVRLKASNVNPTAPNTSVYFKVNWSEEFKLTVHARSIYPCEGSGGVSVLFEYPSCRLEGDRVRVYGRLKADVTSVASPSTLHYITESRSIPGKHSLAFDCDFFTEKFVEYCFIYVSQAITGAMVDVKISCIPTFPFQEGDAAGWGPWSPWSPCSSSCFGGIRNRYRFCDTPPPKYGTKFCQGNAIETEFCGKGFWEESGTKEWQNQIEYSECHGAVLAATKPEVVAEIGLQCRCGCRVTLKEQFTRKILGANTQACPGRSFWLLQVPAETNFVIGLHLNQLQFPCPGQYFRVRDGNSLNADLLIDVTSDKIHHTAKTLISSGENLLLEFFSDELTASGDACIGGFLAHAAVLDKKYLKRNGSVTVVPFEVNSTNVEKEWIFWKPAHLVTALLLILIFIVSIFLTLQFVIKYRKYRIAEDMDNLSDVSEVTPGRSKCLSTSTLISEVFSMIETTTKSSPKEVLRSSTVEQYNSTETLTGYKEESTLSSSTLKLNNTVETSSDETVTSMKSDCDKLLSASSIVYNKPEVKYAYPVRLQRIDYNALEGKILKIENEKLEDRSNDTLKIYQNNGMNYSEGKESSPESTVSSSSNSGGGKETKEKRNREKLLQGPGSEFSLTNLDSELELDYYDYNVANASAVPGSYLGMDPAFLVWIPPIDDIKLDTEDFLLGNKRDSILTLETEGIALTPSEYRRMKLSTFDDFKLELDPGEKYFKKDEKTCQNLDYGSLMKDEISGTTRTRTFEKLLPIQKLLEDSSIKVSMESVSSVLEHKQYCVIPNRRVYIGKDEESVEKSNSPKSILASPINMLDSSENNKEKFNSPSNKVLQKDLLKITQSNSNQRKISKTQEGELTNISCTYKELMACTQSFTNVQDTVNIPMTELSGSPLRNITQVQKRETDVSLNIQNSDCGIEALCIKQGSLYDQNIKFVDDDDDDDYIG